jgi:hypothetical protein
VTVALNQTRLDALVVYFGAAQTSDMIIRAIGGLAARMADLRRTADAPAARRLGHEIKGVAGMYGLDGVAEAALAIEHNAETTRLPDLVMTLDRLMGQETRELGAFARGLTASES